MSRALYLLDFDTPDKRERFESLYRQAVEVFELPPVDGLTTEELHTLGPARDKQYAQLGVFLCAHSHILLALWDGKPSDTLGGTAQVVHFHHYDVMAGFSPETMNQQILADDDSDLVYHIVVSRNRDNGQPKRYLRPLSAYWLTTDPQTPIQPELPPLYQRIFERTSEFNRDVRTHQRRIITESYALFDREEAPRLPRSVHRINRLFCAADWLAIHFQRRFVKALRLSHGLGFLMALMFLLYADFEARQLFMVLFGIFFVAALGANRVAAAAKWHSKYLEYRALAEGLRVQFYWAVAGVTSGSITKYAHDNFLQKQDVELGWIRNVMRVAGIGCDVAPYLSSSELEFVIREWIGDERNDGQVKYYRSKATQYVEHSQRISTINKIASFFVAILVVSAVFAPSEGIQGFVFVALGVILLAISIREAYAFRIAEKEVIKQYEFMYRIFMNARKRIAKAGSDSEKRRILRLLGEAALDEHAEWILLHRERPLEADNLWRMEV